MPGELQLSEIRSYPVGLLESAISKLGRRPRSQGVTAPGLFAARASHTRLLGFAIPVQMSVDDGEPHGRRENLHWWRHIEKQSAGPRVIVAQDISSDPVRGVVCGRLSAHVYSSLGCAGFITNGFVRDAGAMDELNFALFARGRSARHGNPHVVRFDADADLRGVQVRLGDIVAVDEDGMIAFPAAWLDDVIREARALEAKQRPVYEHCRSGKATADSIARVLQAR